jgi:hypothetical protein
VVASIFMMDDILSGVLHLTLAVIDFLDVVESGPRLTFPDTSI